MLWAWAWAWAWTGTFVVSGSRTWTFFVGPWQAGHIRPFDTTQTPHLAQVNSTHIHMYLDNSLGNEMVAPVWGVPEGWGQYVAALFTWVLARENDPVTQTQAMRCARRPKGRSWEAVDDQILKLGE